jgi:hypothetical protein
MPSKFLMVFIPCLTILSLAAPSFAQQRDDELFLVNTQLRLGMPEGVVLKNIVGQSAAGQYSLRADADNEGQYLIMEKHPLTGLYTSAGAVKFAQGRLVFASKHWTSECNGVIGALQAILAKSRPDGEGTAWFKAQILQEPGVSDTVITLAVGKRRITITSGTLKDFGKFIGVDEAIGAKNIP